MHEKEAKTILSTQNGMNLYCGCSYGCVLCDVRATGGRMKHPADDIEIRVNAPELLEVALRRKRSKCMIMTGSMGDPYQPVEEERGLMRRCLEVIDRYGFGLVIQTRSDLVLRDLDLLKSINRKSRCVVQMKFSAADAALSAKLEPGARPPEARAEALGRLRDAGIPAVAWFTPVLPFINDTEDNIRALMTAAVEAGVYGVRGPAKEIQLRQSEKDAFYRTLDERFPGMADRYRAVFEDPLELPLPKGDDLSELVHQIAVNYHIEDDASRLFTYLHAFVDREAGEQMSLFDL